MQGCRMPAAAMSVWRELWEYLDENYFRLNPYRYEHIEIRRNTLFTVQTAVIALFIGVVVGAAIIWYDKRVLGGFVRRICREECFSPEKAKTLAELGYRGRRGVRASLKRGTVLAKVVRCVEREAYEAEVSAAMSAYEERNGTRKGFAAPPFKGDMETCRFYIPDEEHYRAEVRFEAKGTGWRAFLLTVLLSFAGMLLVLFMIPEMLQLADNMIGVFKGNAGRG